MLRRKEKHTHAKAERAEGVLSDGLAVPGRSSRRKCSAVPLDRIKTVKAN